MIRSHEDYDDALDAYHEGYGPYPGEFEGDEDYRMEFADPGGNSALRAETANNPRDCTCPTCGARNVLTRKDRSLGYQCDACSDRDEGGFGQY